MTSVVPGLMATCVAVLKCAGRGWWAGGGWQNEPRYRSLLPSHTDCWDVRYAVTGENFGETGSNNAVTCGNYGETGSNNAVTGENNAKTCRNHAETCGNHA